VPFERGARGVIGKPGNSDNALGSGHRGGTLSAFENCGPFLRDCLSLSQSVLARERVFKYHSRRYGTPVVLIRLNDDSFMAEGLRGCDDRVGERVIRFRVT
jgi:hypothetical protein